MASEAKAITIEDLSSKQGRLTEREKEFIFNYFKEGDLQDHLRINGSVNSNSNIRIYEPIEEYKKNVVLLVELLFNYQFKPIVDTYSQE